MSTREVAAALGLTIGALQQMIFRGLIQTPARRIGPSYVWTEDEVTQLAEDVAVLRLENPLPALTELLNQAQQKLPEERRRSINSVSNVPGFTEKVKSSMSRIGQSGSFTWMFSGTYSPCVGFSFNAGKSIAMPSSPAPMFSHPYE